MCAADPAHGDIAVATVDLDLHRDSDVGLAALVVDVGDAVPGGDVAGLGGGRRLPGLSIDHLSGVPDHLGTAWVDDVAQPERQRVELRSAR